MPVVVRAQIFFNFYSLRPLRRGHRFGKHTDLSANFVCPLPLVTLSRLTSSPFCFQKEPWDTRTFGFLTPESTDPAPDTGKFLSIITFCCSIFTRGFLFQSDLPYFSVYSRVCSNHHGLIRKYGLNMCRRCFRQYANQIGFKKLD